MESGIRDLQASWDGQSAYAEHETSGLSVRVDKANHGRCEWEAYDGSFIVAQGSGVNSNEAIADAAGFLALKIWQWEQIGAE